MRRIVIPLMDHATDEEIAEALGLIAALQFHAVHLELSDGAIASPELADAAVALDVELHELARAPRSKFPGAARALDGAVRTIGIVPADELPIVPASLRVDRDPRFGA